MIENSWLKIHHKEILTDMETVLFDFKPNGERFIVSKDDKKSREAMKMAGITSPDAGEALMMAVSEIRNINKIYDMKQSNLPKYTEQDDGEMMGQRMMKGLPQYTTGG